MGEIQAPHTRGTSAKSSQLFTRSLSATTITTESKGICTSMLNSRLNFMLDHKRK